MSKKLIIAVDGPAGSGKSSTFKMIADKLNYKFIDTGLMYRAFTFLGLQQKINFDNVHELIALIPQFNYQVKQDRIYLNHQDITSYLNDQEVITHINKVTSIPEIRTMMVNQQRRMALKTQRGLIMVGRDITSVVLPKADLKVYLDSSIEKRARRRLEQNRQGIKDLNLIRKQIEHRDQEDKQRPVGPLIKTKDSWYIDNSNLSLEETISMIVKKIKHLE